MKGFGITLASRTRLQLPAVALSMILASCSTTQTIGRKNSFTPPPVPSPAQTNNVPVGRFVPCSQLDIIHFNAPDPDDKTVVETAANVFDTPETISTARKDNAAIHSACGK